MAANYPCFSRKGGTVGSGSLHLTFQVHLLTAREVRVAREGCVAPPTVTLRAFVHFCVRSAIRPSHPQNTMN